MVFTLNLVNLELMCVLPYVYLQALIPRSYPLEITIVFFILFGEIQCAEIALIVVKDLYAKLKPDFEVIASIASYSF